MLSHADTRLPRNVSFEKAQIPSYAEATAIENLPRTSPPAVSSQQEGWSLLLGRKQQEGPALLLTIAV
ncbi:hypothetical protein MRX96_053371 [Rhipicephalus microplus]